MKRTFKIGTDSLTIRKVGEIISGGYQLELSDESVELIRKCRIYLDRKLESVQSPVYGVTTGFGALYNKNISRDQLTDLQRNLVMSHACGMGDVISDDIVRIMLLLKVHALSLGFSGAQEVTIQRLVEMFNREIYPVVYTYGSLGASGDLAPLAHMVLPLLGLGEVHYRGERMDSSRAFIIEQLEQVELQSKEGLALLNGTQFMSAHGVKALMMAEKAARIADIVATISLEGYDGRIEPFFSQLHTLRPHEGQQFSAARVLKMLEASEIARRPKKHVQDPYSFRCVPQVHGATLDAIRYVSGVVETEINSVTDNPIVFPDEDLILSGGNFHGQPLALAFDHLANAVAELGSISERRVYRLISGHRSLPEFLVANPGLNSGFMIPQYTAASLVSRNKQLCTPTSVDSIPSSNEQEDHVSMGANGATRLIQVADNVNTILAIELFTATQALEFRRPLRSSDYIESVVREFRKEVPFIENDRVMYTEIEKARKFVLNYQF